MLKRGRVATKKVSIGEVRTLRREDLTFLAQKRNTPAVQRFRDPHHRVARMVALGIRIPAIASACGYSRQRVDTLIADPAFNSLVEAYRKDVLADFKESADPFMELATSNMLKAERQLAEHLDKADEDGELLPVKSLLAISRDAADRFGYGKKTTNLNVNVDFAAQLEKAIARSGKVQELKPVNSLPNPPPPGEGPVLDLQASPIRRRA